MIIIILGAILLAIYKVLEAKGRKRAKEEGRNYCYDYEGLLVAGITILICGVLFYGVAVFMNVDAQAGAIEKSQAYQEFVDNTDTVTNEGYKQVNEWNEKILTARHNQHYWLWASHYIFCYDWNDVPLVKYRAKEKKE